MLKYGKKILSAVLSAAFLLSLFQFAYAGVAPGISLGSGSGEPGDTEVEIEISISDNIGFNTLNLTLDYNSDVLMFNDVSTGLDGEWVKSGDNLAFTANDVEDEKVNIEDDGIIATVTFAIDEDAVANDYDIDISGGGQDKDDLNDIVFSFVSGSITVTEPQQPEVKYTVTVLTSPSYAGEAYANNSEYLAGETVTIIAENDADYEFDYWDCSDNDVEFENKTESETTFVMPEKNITVRAYYTEIEKYEVSFGYEGGGTATCNKDDYSEGETVRITAHPQSGYSFYSWSAAKSEDVEFKNSANFNTSFEMPDHDVKIRAMFIKNSSSPGSPHSPGGALPTAYTISFDTLGGSPVAPTTAVAGQAVAEPAVAPTKAGYIFDGWYTDTSYNNKYDFYSLVQGNIVLYAKWKSQVEEPPAETIVFNDVKERDWFYKEVIALYSDNIVAGVGEKKFMPNDNITRAQFAKLLSNLAKVNLSIYEDSDFNDIKTTDWFLKPVAWAFDKGIVNGVGNGRFAPNAPITREDMAVMISRYAEIIAGKTLTGTNDDAFSDDDDIADYAKSAVRAMNRARIINGKGGNKFDPKAYATRAEACKMIYELIGVLEE